MKQDYISKQRFILLILILIFSGINSYAQIEQRVQPKWWFGESVAGNLNYYRGTTQQLNDFSTPTAFHKGQTWEPYASLLTEYRPNRIFGGMLNVAYDNRGGNFAGVLAPCNCPATLSTNLSYVSIEPSLRIAPFANAFYVFAGPTLGINISRSFVYTQAKQIDRREDWNDIHKTVFSAQAGAGIDIPLSKKATLAQMTLSPFASFQTNLGQAPRSTESWSIYTFRAGLALKLGIARKRTPTNKMSNTSPMVTSTTLVTADRDVTFTTRPPKEIPPFVEVKETFPIRNSIFFNMGSSEIPNRYTLLIKQDAASFREAQLQEDQPMNLNKGRSARQLAVYYNILNILGDRMRNNPQSTIILEGSSDGNPIEGKQMAENVKHYLVDIYSIDPTRITTVGRDKPVIPSEQPGATKELTLLKEGDRRVDIESTSPELLLQVGGDGSLKPVQITAVQEDPMDSRVVFSIDSASTLLKSWKVQVIDDSGFVQNYGPYTTDEASVPGRTILGNKAKGNYKILMFGETPSGHYILKQDSVSLVKLDSSNQIGLRYSILFDFDKSKTIDSYKKFLIEQVVPLISDNAKVIIHGHTDTIGDINHNLVLSRERAKSTQEILQRAINNSEKKGVTFVTSGYGADSSMAPFENDLPEQRFYNRTVIIDIVPKK